jgi:hypothetical protein
VKERAVADVLEHVPHLGERGHADPLRPFTAHMRDAVGVALHPERHGVAADPGSRKGTLGDDGGTIVRAATAEIGRPRQRQFDLARLQRRQTRRTSGDGFDALST